MKHLLFVIALSIASLFTISYSGVATASDVKLSVNTVAQAGFDNLTAEQQAQIVQTITAAQAKGPGTLESVDKWVNVGERIGKMVGGAAREVGIAANDFVKTDVGKMTAAMIVWNYMGADVVNVFVHVGGGTMIIFVGLTWIFIVMRRGQYTSVVYSSSEKNWFGNYVVTERERAGLTSDQQMGYTISAAAVLVLGLVAILTAL